MKKAGTVKAKKYTTYLFPTQIAWLKRHALEESERQCRLVTPAEVLRNLIDKEMPSQ
jgi:hypothetical protein